MTQQELKPSENAFLDFAKLFAIKHCNDPESIRLIHMIDEQRASNRTESPEVKALVEALNKAHVGLHHVQKSIGALPCHDLTVLMSIDSVIRFELKCIEKALAQYQGGN